MKDDITQIIKESRSSFIEQKSEIIHKNIQLFISKKEQQIFGIEKEIQKKINYDESGPIISKQMGFDTNQFTQLIGDSQLFSCEGTVFAKEVFKDFAFKKYPNSIILYGFTGKYDQKNSATDTNHLLSLMVDNHEIDSKRVIGNIVDYHTPLAINEWPGVCIPEHVMNYTMVYTDTINPEARFGDDTTTTDSLINTAAICLEGGIQSLLQLMNLIYKRIPIVGVTGLRDLSNLFEPRSYDQISGKPYLSAIGFLLFIKENVISSHNHSETEVKNWINKYFETFSLTNPKAKDADTKEALWKEAIDKFFAYKIWEKLDVVEIVSLQEKNNKLSKLDFTYIKQTGSPIFSFISNEEEIKGQSQKNNV